MKVASIVLFSLIATLVGCSSSASRLNTADPIEHSQCQVTVHSSLEAAKSKGEIEELCIITGTSSGSFSHTVATAINKHKNRACDFGAKDVYIQAQDAGTLGTASVTLIGFRYYDKKGIGKSVESQKLDKKSEKEKAKKCQSKGGLWLDGRCEIDID